MFQKDILSNGIVLVTEVEPQFMSASVGLCLKTGSRYETDNERGISHFIEHLLFKGTTNRTAKEISTAIDGVGGILNASCGKEFTCFYAKVVDKDLPVALELLTDMLCNPLFNQEDIEKERTVILEEIKSREDSPADYVFDLYLQTLWGNHPLAKAITGDELSVLNLKREDILNYFNHNYVPESIIISLAGNVNPDEVVKFFKSNIEKLDRPFNYAGVEPPIFKNNIKTFYKDSGQVHLCMGYAGISLRDERRYAAMILDNILGGNVSSRLYQKIREELGLVYSVYSFQNNFLDCGLFSIYAATSPENIKKVISIVKDEIENLCSCGITEEELKLSKSYINGGMVLSLESTSNRMFYIARTELIFNKLISIKEILKKINSVTKDDIIELAREIFHGNTPAVCMLGPVEKAEDYLDF